MLFKNQIKKKNRDLEQVLKDIVGHVVECEDGVYRTVIEATEPASKWHAKSGLIIINENDPTSKLGYYVHMLTIQCKLDNLPPPSKEAKDAASRLWRQIVMMNAQDLLDSQRKGKMPFDFSE